LFPTPVGSTGRDVGCLARPHVKSRGDARVKGAARPGDEDLRKFACSEANATRRARELGMSLPEVNETRDARRRIPGQGKQQEASHVSLLCPNHADGRPWTWVTSGPSHAKKLAALEPKGGSQGKKRQQPRAGNSGPEVGAVRCRRRTGGFGRRSGRLRSFRSQSCPGEICGQPTARWYQRPASSWQESALRLRAGIQQMALRWLVLREAAGVRWVSFEATENPAPFCGGQVGAKACGPRIASNKPAGHKAALDWVPGLRSVRDGKRRGNLPGGPGTIGGIYLDRGVRSEERRAESVNRTKANGEPYTRTKRVGVKRSVRVCSDRNHRGVGVGQGFVPAQDIPS